MAVSGKVRLAKLYLLLGYLIFSYFVLNGWLGDK